MKEILKQRQYEPVAVENQVMILYLSVNGYLDDVNLKNVGRFEKEFYSYLGVNHPEISATIRTEQKISEETSANLVDAIDIFKQTFTPSVTVGPKGE